MLKPTSIRMLESLLYLNLVLFSIIAARSVAFLINPPETSPSLTGADYVFIVFPIVFAAAMVITIVCVRRRQRLPAGIILGVLLLLWILSFNIMYILLLGVSLFLLFVRSSTTYFSGIPVPASEPVEVEETGGPAASPQTSSPLPSRRTPRNEPAVEIRPAGPEEAETIHSLMIAAFEEYRAAVPPSSALDETVESVKESLRTGQGAAILYENDKPAAMVRYSIDGETITFFRLSVLPARRRRGYGKRLVKWIEQFGISKGLNVCRCKVRQTVQNNVAMYQDMGYEIVNSELVVRPAGSVKTQTMEKKLGV